MNALGISEFRELMKGYDLDIRPRQPIDFDLSLRFIGSATSELQAAEIMKAAHDAVADSNN